MRRTPRGYDASFGALPVGVFASEELAWRSLDILRLKSGQDAGLPVAGIDLRLPLEVRCAPHAQLPSACSGCRGLQTRCLGVPSCSPPFHCPQFAFHSQDYLDPRTQEELRAFDLPAVVAAVRSFAVGGARAPRCAVIDGPTPASAPGANDLAADELVAWRGVTRESGRQQAYVSLLYAALE